MTKMPWAVVAMAVTTACGGGSSASLTPTSPTSIGGAPTAEAGAVITGRVNGVAAASSGLAGTDRWSAMATTGITVSVVGTAVTTTADATGQFTLTGVPPGTVQLKFSGNGVDATLTISGVTATDRIDISVTLSGSNARLDSDRRSTSNNGVDVQGLITNLNVAGRTLTVAGQTVNVPATAVIRHGSVSMTLGDLKVGDRVQVKGTRVGTTLTATEVKVETQSDNGVSSSAEVKGAISGLTGTCPSVTFTVGATKVTTTSTTAFKDGACGALKNGTLVEVEGRRNADGSITADEVENSSGSDDDDEDDEDEDRNSWSRQTEISGLVAGLGGACPSITFTLGGAAVKTDGRTDFKDACAKIKNAVRVEVKGTREADGKVLATRVALDD